MYPEQWATARAGRGMVMMIGTVIQSDHGPWRKRASTFKPA
jgi:hypothetical protein